MKKGILLLTMLVMILTTGIAQTITTGNVTSPICAGATISIPYTVTGTFTAGNRFVAQLSNSVRSFNTPILLDSVTSTASGIITAKIPYGIPAGTAYIIRIIGTTPAITGSGTSDLTINTLPIITISSTSGITATVTTLAGNSTPGSTNGTGTAALFYNPRLLATDASGNVYVPDLTNGLIRKITPAGVVTTFASGLNGPGGVAVDASGNVYVAEYSGGRVLKYTSAGGAILATIATGISNPSGIAVDYEGNVYVAEQGGTSVYKFTPAGVRTTFASGLRNPTGVALDASGNVYVADLNAHLIRKYIPTGATNIVLAGNGSAAFADGPGANASFYYPHGLAVDPLGNVYVGDQSNHRVRKISTSGVVTTLAGTGATSSVNGLGSAATFNAPVGIAIDPSGNIYVAEYYAHNIRKITQTTISCNGNPLTLSAGGGTSYSWAGPQTITNGTSFNSVTSGIYTVTATNANGCIAKQVIYDSVASLPVITGPTNSITSPLCSGNGTQRLSVTATVTGTGNTLSYQWYKGTGISTDTLLTNTAPFTTATTNALTLTNPSDLYKGNYYVKVTSSVGNCVVKSNNINVVINPEPKVTITSSPTNTDLASTNTSVTFTATPINFGNITTNNPTYQWYKNNALVTGATLRTYTNASWSNGSVDSVWCIVKSASNVTIPCFSQATAKSNTINIDVENTTANSISSIANLGADSRRYSVSFSIHNKGYFGLGLTNISVTEMADFWEYSPETNSWAQKANFPGGVRMDAFSFSIGDKGYVGGGTGITQNTMFNDFWQFDPIANTWVQKTNFGGGQITTAKGFSIGKYGYVGLGVNLSGVRNANNFWRYNSEAANGGTWEPMTNYPGTSVSRPTGFSLGIKGYLGGGGPYLNDTYTMEFYEFNPEANLDPVTNILKGEWTQKDNIPGSNRGYYHDYSIGMYGFVGAGMSNIVQNTVTNNDRLYKFDPTKPNATTPSGTSSQWSDILGGMSGLNSSYAFSVGNKAYIGQGSNFNDRNQNNNYEYTPTGTTIKTQNPSIMKLCKESTFTVSYTIGAKSFNSGNKFVVQLSDEFGTFSNPLKISDSTVELNNNRTISAYIPTLNIASSSKYRIRVVGSNPYTIGYVTDAIRIEEVSPGVIGTAHTVPYPAHLQLDSLKNNTSPTTNEFIQVLSYFWQRDTVLTNNGWKTIQNVNTDYYKFDPDTLNKIIYKYRRGVNFSCGATFYTEPVTIKVFTSEDPSTNSASLDGTITGRVVSKGTATGVKDCKIYLQKLVSLKGSPLTHIDSVTTDGGGNYTFKNIFYGDLNNGDPNVVKYKIWPAKKDHIIKTDLTWRGQNPAVVTMYNDSTYIDSLSVAEKTQGLNIFEDYTTLPITGAVVQKCFDCITNTSPFVGLVTDSLNGVTIKLEKNGSNILSDTTGVSGYGKYGLTAIEPGNYKVVPFKQGHRIKPVTAGLNEFYLENPINMVDFIDDSMHFISGKFSAGGDEYIGKIVLEFSDTVKGRTVKFKKRVTTDNDGNYSISLPPRKYKVKVISYTPPTGLVSFAQDPIIADSILRFFNVVYKDSLLVDIDTISVNNFNFIYHRPPVLTIENLDDTCSTRLKVFYQNIFRKFVVKCYEGQPYHGVLIQRDSANSDTLQILTNIHKKDLQGTIDTVSHYMTNGIDTVSIIGGIPNLTEDHFKVLRFRYEDRFKRLIDTIIPRVFVDGYKPNTGTFTTVSPEVPILILHAPPGDNSLSTWEQSKTAETVISFGRSMGVNAGIEAEVKYSSTKTTFAGAGIGVFGGLIEEVGGWVSVSGSLETNSLWSSSTEGILSNTSTVSYSTEPGGGDVFIGAALNINYAVADIVELKGCAIITREDYVMNPAGYSTTYTYSEGQIRDVVMPTLNQMASQAPTIEEQKKYENQYHVWQQVLENNDRNKTNASFVRNRSFDGNAGPITESVTSSSTNSNSIAFDLDIDASVALSGGLIIGDFEVSGKVSVGFVYHSGNSKTTTNTEETVISYTLDDDDAGDYYSVDIKKDKVYNTPVFNLIAGTSSCPPEEIAQNRDLCILEVAQLVNGLPNQVQRNIATNGEALFQLKLKNFSESRETRTFSLSFDHGSNPDAAIVTIGGVPAVNDLTYEIPHLGTQIVTVSVKKNPASTVYSYEGLKFVLADGCSDDEDAINSENTISAYFATSCSDINISEPTSDWYANSYSNNMLPVAFNGYNRNNLQTVSLEYAHVGRGDWQSGRVINQNGSSGTVIPQSLITNPNATTVNWDITDVPDDKYEIRLKLTCASGTIYTNRVSGVIDRQAPILSAYPQPSDNSYARGDEMSFTFNENLNTAAINSNNIKLMELISSQVIPVQVSVYENKINIVPTLNVFDYFMNDTLLLIVKNISDIYSNINTPNEDTIAFVVSNQSATSSLFVNLSNKVSNKSSIYENSGDSLAIKFKYSTRANTNNYVPVQFIVNGSSIYNSGYKVSYSGGQNLTTIYTASEGVINLPPRQDSVILYIKPINDFIREEDETITLTLISGGDYNVGSVYSITDTIKNDDYNKPIITANRGLCPGGSILLTTPTQIEGINITAYQWRLNDTIVGTSTNTISVNRPGAYTVKVTTANGFTGLSNVYNVATSISPVSTTNMAICRGVLPYIWNGLSINAAGTYSATLSNSEGCDSIATLVFTIKEPTTGIETIYTDEAPYIWHDIEYYTSNDEATFTEVNAAGCDSVVTLNLTIANTCLNTRATFNVSACNSYTWHGMRITTSQTLLWYTINAAGCDSIETLNLIIKSPTSSTIRVSVCSNQMPYVYNGYTYNNVGTYSRRLVNAAGCDSVVKLIITLKYPTSSNSNVAVCNNQLPYVWNGLNLSTSGNYNVTLTNAVGCDSVANIVFTVKNTSTSTTVYTTCDNQLPYVWNGLTLNTTGNYSATLINAVGCDSVASINFSVNNTTSSLTTTTICSDGLPYAWNGQALTEAGTYIATLAGSNGCDSVATLNLSVNESPIAVVNANGPTTFCSGGSVTLTAANALSILTGANDSAYASSVINISSEYLPCPNIWSSCQLLGAPNTYPSYGDIGTAWTTASFGNREFIELGFNHSTPINYIDIYETYHPGYIDTVYVKNPNTGSFEVVYSGTAQNAGNQSRIMHIEFPTTAFNVSEIRIAINLEGFYNYYEIDAVKIGKRAAANETTVDQYLWSNGETTTSIVPSISGSYTVTATAPNGCSLTSAPVDVTILTNNTYAVTGGGSYCDGGTGNAIGLDGSEVGVRYQLKLNGGYVGQPQVGTGAALNFGVFTNQGRYTVDATNTTTGCTKAMSGFADISIIALPNFAVTPTAASVCIGEEVQLAVSDAINYCMPTNSNPSVSNISEVHLNTLHSYLNQQSNQVHFNEPVNNNTTMLVAGQSYELSLTTVSWANSNTSVWIDYNSNGLFESNEWVKLWSDARTGSVMINVPANAINGLTRLRVRSDFTWYQLLAENACSNRECGTTEDYMITIEGGLSPETLQYTWNNGASIGNTFVVTPSASTEYTVSTTSATTGCTKTITIPVTVNALPNAPVIVAGGSTALCAGSEVTLTIQGDEGVINSTEPSASYTWSNGATGASTTVNQVGSYTVTKTNLNGCSSISAPVNITLKNSTVSTTELAVCNNQLPYVWNGLTLNTAGNYSATLINAEGCDSVATINFSIKNTTSSLTNLTICNHELPYSWNGQTLPSGGTYNATLTGSNGCDSVAIIVLSTIASPIALINANGPTTFCAGGSVTLTTANQPVNESALILPLDLNSTSVLAVGLRKLKSSYNGSIIRLRRESDNAEQDFGSVGINLDVNAIDAWLEGSTGYCVKLYNQAGNVGGADVSQVDQSKQPVYVANGIYNRPMLHFNTSQNLFNNTNYPVPFSIVYGSRVTGYAKRVLSSVNNNWWLGYWDGKMDNASFGTWLTGDNTPQVDNQYIIYTGKTSGSTARLFRNGVAITPSTSGSFSGPNGIKLNGGAYPGEESEVDFTDVLIYNTNLLPNDVTLINNAVNSYYTYVDNSGVNYLWSSGDTTRSITPTITGSYTVTATAPNGCTLTSAPVDVTILTNNTYAVTGGGSHCAGGTGNAIGLDGSEVGVQYQLKLNGGSVGQPQEGTGTALNFGVFNIQGRYTVDATNTTTGCTKVMSGFADINIISLPNFAVTPTTASVCLGEEVQFTASSVNNYCLPTSGYPYYANINQVHLNTLHSYLSGSQSQTHFNEPVDENTTTLVAGQSYELSFNTNGGATSAVWIDYNNNRLFEPSEWVRPLPQGNSGSAMINVPANATSGLTRMRVRSNYYWQISAEDACSNLSYGSTEDYMITIQGGLAPETLQYTWNNGASIGNTFVATPSASTEYTVSTTSANTGCTKTITIPVTVNALPNAPVITTSGASTLCAGSDVTLTLQGNEGVINPTVPLDEVNGASLAVGLRKLNSNYNGAALRLRRSSDDAEQDFGFTGNNLDVNAITTWLDGADGYCTTLYDQSNNGGNVTQAINDKQPVLVLSGINNKPVLHFNSSQFMNNQVNYSSPFTAIYGARNTDLESSGRVLTSMNNNWLLGYWNNRMDVAFFEGFVLPESEIPAEYTVTNDYTIYAGKSNGSISSYFKNGNLLHSNSGGVTGPNGISFNYALPNHESSNFDITDVIIYPTDLSTANIVSLNNSIGQYYGSGTLSSASYTWSNGTTGSSTIVNQLGSYTVTKTNLNGCSITSEPIVIGKMTAEISGNETICAGTSANVIISVTGVGPWSGTLSDGTAFNGTTSPIIVAVSPNTTTSYTIVSLNGPDCSVSAADLIGEASVVVRNVVSASISGSVSTCNSEPATININVTGDGPWFGTLDDGTAFSGNSNIISVEVNPTATSVYSIASLNGEYCMANPDNLTGTITVFVNELVTGTIAGNATICNGANAQLSITVTGKGPWSGTLNNGMTFSGSVSPILIDVTPTSTTTYSIASLNGLECSALSSNLNGTATIQVNNQTTSINDVTICDNQLPYSWNNNNYEAAGTYSVTLTGSNGCDSVATINLVVNAVTYSTTNISICSNQLPFVWNDISISNAGAYTKTLVNAMGCDSMATLNFSIKNTSTSTTRFTLCSSELPMIWNGLTLTASGTYSRSLNNSVGCDSLAVIVLNVKQTSNTVDYVSAVGSYTWHGATYTSSNNTAMWTGVNAVGCDSTVRLDLTITYECTDSDSTLNVTACKVYVWKGIRSTTSTTLEWVGVNAGGCDSVVTLNLTITTLAPTVAPASITQTLVSNVCGAKVYRYTAAASVNASGYQWILPNSVGGVSGVFVDSGDINNSITIRVRYNSNNAAITGDSIKVKAFSVCGSTANRTVRLTNTLLTPPLAPANITATAISINTCGAKRYRYIAPPLTAVTTTAAAATGYSWSFKGTLGVNAFIDSGNIGSQIITVTYSNNSAAATGDSVKVLYTSVCGNSAARALKLTNTLLSAPLAPTTVTITPVQTNVCGARKYRYSASALATATASTMPATGWLWSLPAEGTVGSTGTIDSGDVNSQTIVMKYTSNAAAAAGDTIRVAYTSACGLSVAKATKLTNTLIAAPLAPATVTVTPLVTNICGARKYRYSAAGLAASTTTATAATGWLWSLPAEGTVGSTGIKDSGEINSQTIVVIYSSNAAAAAGDTIRVAYTSSCGLGAAKATKLTNTLLSAPLAPATVTIATVSDICGARVYRYIAPALPLATTTAGAANGYLWHMPKGTLGLTGVLDSGSLTSKVIRIRYSSNAAALTGDSIKLAYTSACGNSLPKAMKLSNLAPTLLAASATLTGTTSICSVVGTSTSNRYIATAVTGALSYVWTLPAGAVLDSGSNGLKIKVRFLTAGANDSIFVQAVGANGCAGAKKVLKLVTTGCVTQLISRTNVPATIKTIVEPMQVNVYPNPSTSAFQMFVKTPSTSKIAMRILDIQGRLIKTISFNSDETIAFGNDLKSGVYFVELREGKVVKTVRVVKY